MNHYCGWSTCSGPTVDRVFKNSVFNDLHNNIMVTTDIFISFQRVYVVRYYGYNSWLKMAEINKFNTKVGRYKLPSILAFIFSIK